MNKTTQGTELESLPTGVLELEGEPAIVINGVPDVAPGDKSLGLSTAVTEAESQVSTSLDAEFLGNTGFGEWLEGRVVQKLFGEQYYTGTITYFDKDNGWYRVEYEDGDFEDLDWCELEEILLPLDITIPLKSLALKVSKRSQKTIPNSGKNATRSRSIKSIEAIIQS